MYEKIFLALDGSIYSDMAIDAGISIGNNNASTLIGCHVYGAKLHKVRFNEMEPGLPDQYQEEEKLDYLRSTHDDLIKNGMNLISDAYLAPLIKKAQEKGLNFEGFAPEGRNYVEILRLIKDLKPNLVILGGFGHGVVKNTLGSLTQRILLHDSDTDILIIKKPFNFKYRPVVVGIDGSENSYNALKRSVEIAKIFNTKVNTVAAYDPYFHTGVFRTIADVLPLEYQKKFNFVAQEKIHDEIIDKGLEKLYFEGLEKGELIAQSMDMQISKKVLMGKVYSKILNYADLNNAGLIVLGRWGIHKESSSLIGSNAFNVAMSCESNILIVSKSEGKIEIPNLPTIEKIPINWTNEAQTMIKNIPPFARKMAIAAIEDYAREKGLSEIIPELVGEVANNLGMGENMMDMKPSDEILQEKKDKKEIKGAPEAEKVILKKIKKLAPNFHKNILKSKIVGEIVEKGEKQLVYEIIEIFPSSPALVTEKTILEFK